VGPMTRDAACSALLPYYSANSGRSDSISSHAWSRAHLLLGKGSGDATCLSRRDAQHMQMGSRACPSRGLGPPRNPRTSLVRAPALYPGRSGTAACPAPAGARRTLTCRTHGTQHWED